MRILDLATGSGDIPRLIVDHARSRRGGRDRGRVDQQASTLEIARGLSGDYPEIVYPGRCPDLWGDRLRPGALFARASPFSDEDRRPVLRRCASYRAAMFSSPIFAAACSPAWGVYLLTAFFATR